MPSKKEKIEGLRVLVFRNPLMIFLTHCVLCGLSGKQVQKLKAIIKEAGLTVVEFLEL